MGGNAAKKANNIAAASLAESQRQYAEQQAEKERAKATARANAQGSRTSANMAYSNNFFQSTDYTTGADGSSYSLLTAGGTPSILGSMLGTSMGMQDTLG